MYTEQLNQALAVTIEAAAVMVEVEGMKSANAERLADDKALAYDEAAFQNKVNTLCAFAGILRGLG